MSDLLALAPYGARQDDRLLQEMNHLTRHHLAGCPPYEKLFTSWKQAKRMSDLPYLHVGVFKRMDWRTEGQGIKHQRTLTSSSTSGQQPSRILLDEKSSALQAGSVQAIHEAIIGKEPRPLLILDEARSLRERGQVSARLAAAMSLQSLATETHFLLDSIQNPRGMRWDILDDVLKNQPHFIVYGTTWLLWQSWIHQAPPQSVATLLKNARVDFIHSGGWKKLEDLKVERREFDERLLQMTGAKSQVVDYYGLSEQAGLFFPLCREGKRHAPIWSDVIVRDVYTMEPTEDKKGLLQFVNPLAWGAPYHSVLTEDLGRLGSGECTCGLRGRNFEFLGRVPHAEIRGCGHA